MRKGGKENWGKHNMKERAREGKENPGGGEVWNSG